MNVNILSRFVHITLLFLLSACGFHLKTISIPADFTHIKPIYEQKEFTALAPSTGFINKKNASIKFSQLEITPHLIYEENTGNKWRQYRYTAQWIIYDQVKQAHYTVVAHENINLPPNQSPYQRQLISSQLDGLRYKLLNESQFILTKAQLGSSASGTKVTN